jgi:ADP-ribosylglycohydrolase
MTLPSDYAERTYAGVLGKIIGVYLGRPFESWTYDRIMDELGEINYYVNGQRGVPLVITDDDITGTFTFVRALADHGLRRDLSAYEIGQSWLNYIIEKRTILWWGGMGNSTEHTAYLRLKRGVPAPASGSIAVNGRTVAEQIGAQIFIDGWAMVAPGDPELAAYLARQAASVSHDGEAIYGAQVIAVMEAQAYVERDLNVLLDTAVRFIPADSIIRRLIDDVREWHAELRDWRDARQKVQEFYGYDRYGGNCHMIPNHALIHLALLYGDDNFQKALMIANTCGWDTDCNSGNVGCVLGIKNGLEGIDAGPDYRTPVADRLYLPSADGAGAITDAAAETIRLVNVGRALVGEPPITLKGGSRFHFELPGSVQGFAPEDSPEARGVLMVENVAGFSRTGTRSLALRYRALAHGRLARAATNTFIPPEDKDMQSYGLYVCPTLYPGQIVTAGVMADEANGESVDCRLYLQVYGADDRTFPVFGSTTRLTPGQAADLSWRVPDVGGAPIARIGLEIIPIGGRTTGTVYLDYLTWAGEPEVVFVRPPHNGTMWRRAWVNAVDSFEHYWPEAFRPIHNEGTGLLIQGTREWCDYAVSAIIKPHMFDNGGLAARVQGMRRYYALLLVTGGKARLVKALDSERTLAEIDYAWQPETDYALKLEVQGAHIAGWIDGQRVFDIEDADHPLMGGAIALVVTEGRMATEAVSVAPVR